MGKALGEVARARTIRRERAARAAELQHARLVARRAQPRQRARERREPHCDLPAERHGRRGLEQRARKQRRALVPSRQLRERIADTLGELDQTLAGLALTERYRGVEHILTRGAEMDMARGVGRDGGDLIGERLDERDGERAGFARGARKRFGVEGRHAAHLGNDVRLRRRQQAALRARSRERRFESRHRGE